MQKNLQAENAEKQKSQFFALYVINHNDFQRAVSTSRQYVEGVIYHFIGNFEINADSLSSPHVIYEGWFY